MSVRGLTVRIGGNTGLNSKHVPLVTNGAVPNVWNEI